MSELSNRPFQLHIGIYYEALCYDSSQFIRAQLAPNYQHFKDHLELLFVPFGKSESENDGEAFFCQHGPAECSGNLMQSCVIDALDNDPEKSLHFVGCQMGNQAEFSGKQVHRPAPMSAARLNGFDWIL